MNNSTIFNFSLSRLRHSLLDESNRAGYFFKHVLTLLFLFASLYSSSKNYYADPLAQASQNIGSEENPWVTLEQVTSATAMLLPGDTVFFKRGRKYIGKLNILASGAMNAPIVFTTYGSGDMPEFDNTLTHVIKIAGKQYVVIDGFDFRIKRGSCMDNLLWKSPALALVSERAFASVSIGSISVTLKSAQSGLLNRPLSCCNILAAKFASL